MSLGSGRDTAVYFTSISSKDALATKKQAVLHR